MQLNSNKAFGLLAIGLIASFFSFAKPRIDKVEPSQWWSNMSNNRVQLLLYGSDLTDCKVASLSKSVKVVDVLNTEKDDYLLVYLEIAPNTDEEFSISVSNSNGKSSFKYMVTPKSDYARGLSSEDFIYLIMPDRFANGDPKNDSFDDMKQVGVNRSEPYQRHGGDLLGIIDHLDYLEDLGTTALWLNPVYTNDEMHESYHGYAITDHYNVDPRLGSLRDYKTLADELHNREMKLVKDVVYNHFGDEHLLAKNPPFAAWVNEWDEYTRSNFRATTLLDPYRSESDLKQFTDGWFDVHMPDMNQRDPYLATYLIQQTIWWVEKFDIDALRIDTYAYPDQSFMASWSKAMEEEYPDLFVFAETWVHGEPVQAFFVESSSVNQPFDNHLHSVTDFQMYYALNKVPNQPFGWTEGISSVYYVLAKDLLYESPNDLVTFVDNHDLARYHGITGGDMRKFKVGYGMLLTLRGIPQILYGSEVAMKETENHGVIREDFWGGWKEDTVNLFDPAQHNEEQAEAYNFIRTLANFRKESEAITRGKTMHFVPEQGVYTYFRYTDEEAVMVIVNASDEEKAWSPERYAEMLTTEKGIDVLTGEQATIGKFLLNSWEIKLIQFSRSKQ